MSKIRTIENVTRKVGTKVSGVARNLGSALTRKRPAEVPEKPIRQPGSDEYITRNGMTAHRDSFFWRMDSHLVPSAPATITKDGITAHRDSLLWKITS
jgi:hypothetical protein